jgi:iron(III) transport system ATP-binding protein
VSRASDPALELTGVAKGFGHVQAVQGVDLRVADRELLALVGPSGCGKSTLLSLIAGLQAPDAGQIRIGGQLVAGRGVWVAPERRHVGIVLQEAALFPHLTVAGNIGFGLPAGRTRVTRVAELLDLVELDGLGRRYPHELSGGQQQRVALARALAPQPRLVLFDEPFANLDHNLRLMVRHQTQQVLRATGSTAVFVTHDQAEALALGDRVAVLRAGQVEQVAAPETVFSAPATRFVATFLGEADFLPGLQDDDLVRTELGTCPAVKGPSGAVEVMLRPHEVTAVADADGSAHVVDREFRGGFALYHLTLSTGAQIRTLQPHTIDWPAGTSVQPRLQTGHPVATFPPSPRSSHNGTTI